MEIRNLRYEDVSVLQEKIEELKKTILTLHQTYFQWKRSASTGK